MVKLDPADARMPVLQWYEIKRNNDHGGELLAAFELFLVRESLFCVNFNRNVIKLIDENSHSY